MLFLVHISFDDGKRFANFKPCFCKTKGTDATYLLGSEETVEREFGNLKRINDNYEKIVVSLDPVSGELAECPGIKHMHLRDFLLQTD